MITGSVVKCEEIYRSKDVSREEFEKFYTYITAVVANDNGEKMKDTFWKSLRDTTYEKAIAKAMEVYKFYGGPCEPCLFNPKVFSGEIPNPGLFRRVYCDLLC